MAITVIDCEDTRCNKDTEEAVCVRCCDFVPKDYLTWAAGWEKQELERPIDSYETLYHID